MNDMIDMQVLGLTLDSTSRTPILVLQSTSEQDVLPIWIGGVEAMAISMALNDTYAERPLTHDLMVQALQGLGARIASVSITGMQEGVFFAVIDIVQGTNLIQVDCRPSDAVALALRVQAPIRASRLVLAQAPKERYMAAAAGLPRTHDEAMSIARRSLEQGDGVRHALSLIHAGPKAEGGNAVQAGDEGKICSVIAGGDATSAVNGNRPDEDAYSTLLRELEPASKNRM